MSTDPRITLLSEHVRDIPDFPKPGILFKDITPLLADSTALRVSIEVLADKCRDLRPDVVVGIESRGFLFGVPLAMALGAGFVPVRKPGKLPYKRARIEYALEYGSDALEMHEDAVTPGQRVLVVDDVIATGGTARATCQLIRQAGAEPIACAFLIELSFLDGGAKLAPVPTIAALRY